MLPPTPPPSNAHSLTAQVIGFQEQYAVLRNEAAGEFKWPLANLPSTIAIGETVTLKLATGQSEEDEKFFRMRRLLEELIN